MDVGAGTGKFTALLVPSGADVVAVEPLAAMREGFVAELAGVRVVEGSAEAMPLANSSADAIVAAQAFHWFDRSRALPEFARVLRPDGRLGVIWNDIDTSVEWASEFYAIVSPGPVGGACAMVSRRRNGTGFGQRHQGDQKWVREGEQGGCEASGRGGDSRVPACSGPKGCDTVAVTSRRQAWSMVTADGQIQFAVEPAAPLPSIDVRMRRFGGRWVAEMAVASQNVGLALTPRDALNAALEPLGERAVLLLMADLSLSRAKCGDCRSRWP